MFNAVAVDAEGAVPIACIGATYPQIDADGDREGGPA
jgi:hypothetical protein